MEGIMRVRQDKLYTIVLCTVFLLMLLSASNSFLSASSLSDITSDSIKEMEDEIKEAEQAQEEIKENITNMENALEDLEDKRNDLDDYIEAIDQDISSISNKISDLENSIADKELEVTKKTAELFEAIKIEEQQYEDMSLRIQYMYENGEESYLEALLTSESFSDFLNRAEYVSQLADYDDQMLKDFILQREALELQKLALEEEHAVLEALKEAEQAEKANLETLSAQKNQDLAAFNHDIEQTEELIQEYEEDLEYQSNFILALENEINEERQKIAEENGLLGYAGGLFAVPVESYTRISSDYGWRSDPFTGAQKFHSGIDYAAPTGTAILSAYDGVVSAVGYDASMGYYVMVDHGDNLYTVYMHCSATYVSTNEVVYKGDSIAAVGSTGRSTGPHLHFSVRLNGSYVNPWDYLK